VANYLALTLHLQQQKPEDKEWASTTLMGATNFRLFVRTSTVLLDSSPRINKDLMNLDVEGCGRSSEAGEDCLDLVELRGKSDCAVLADGIDAVLVALECGYLPRGPASGNILVLVDGFKEKGKVHEDEDIHFGDIVAVSIWYRSGCCCGCGCRCRSCRGGAGCSGRFRCRGRSSRDGEISLANAVIGTIDVSIDQVVQRSISINFNAVDSLDCPFFQDEQLVELFGEVLNSDFDANISLEEDLQLVVELLDVRALRDRIAACSVFVELLQDDEQLAFGCSASNSELEVVNSPVNVADVDVGDNNSKAFDITLRDDCPAVGV